MNNAELIERLAERTHTTPAEAADQLDAVVHKTLRKLRRGKKVVWPGLGQFQPGSHAEIRFEGNARKPSRPRKGTSA
jgi:nucleoid DNA-binding protein